MLSRSYGMSLIELMLTLAILGVLLGLGIPVFQTMMQNFQIRTAAEALVSGLQTARNEAVRRNTSVRFQLVNSMDVECDLSATGPHWVVSRNDPTGKCQLAAVSDFLEPNIAAEPQFLMKRSAEDGTAGMIATVGAAAATTVIFNSVGRVSPGAIDTIEVFNTAGGNCEHLVASPGKMRCMKIRIGAGGQIKMCDPKVAAVTPPAPQDSRYCQ